MLDKIKLRLRQTVFETFLRRQLFAFKEFCMEMGLSNIFKTTNVTNLVIPENSYRVLQIISK